MWPNQGTARPWWASCCLWLAALCAPPAWAHLMPAQQGTLNVVGNAVFVVLALPASLVPQADTDGDGRLSQAELHTHATVAQQRVTRGIRLSNAAGTPQAEDGEVALINLLAEPEATHFLALVKYQFRTEPTALELETDLFGPQEAEQQLTLKVSRGDTTEAAVLRPGHATHRFFRSPWQVFADYVQTGVAHIVSGADHLLFLATTLVAGAGWPYWLAVLTGFTVAHSITLALGLLGWVRVSPEVVEPLIAASIVLVAALNLANRRRAAPSTARQAAVVFACGLLHGLGFASSLADMGLHGSYRAASLLGFNLGIELGQALCLAGMLGLLRLAEPWHRHRLGALAPLPVLTSAMALVVGAFWVVQRLAYP
jgi:hypothetical protein